MSELSNASVSGLADRGDSLLLQGRRYVGCEFVDCHLSLTKDIRRRSVVREVELIGCSAVGCSVGPAILEDVTVDGLSTNDLLLVWGAVFSRVKLAGVVGKLKLNPLVDPVDTTGAYQAALDAFRADYYHSVEWALDISAAKFVHFECRGIPARLIRRDPGSQVVITRERALSVGWRERLSPWNRLWPFAISLFLGDGDPDTVLVAPMGAPKKKRDELLRGLDELRRVGVAEPD